MQRTIVCLKWGEMYGPEYVNNLYAMIRRNLQGDFRFVCLTDNSTGIRSDVDCQPLPDFPEPEWKYARYCSAWRKLALFDAGKLGLNGRILFLDLDLVILSPIDELFEGDAPFLMLENWYQPGNGQASLMRYDGDFAKPVLDEYLADSETILKTYVTEQAFIADRLCVNGAYFDPSYCVSFKKHVMHSDWRRFTSKPYDKPEGAKVIVFHGRPNPPDAIKGEWGKSLPALKRWWKGLKPCPWIADYWRE